MKVITKPCQINSPVKLWIQGRTQITADAKWGAVSRENKNYDVVTDPGQYYEFCTRASIMAIVTTVDSLQISLSNLPMQI